MGEQAPHSFVDFEWACGHTGTAACCQCFDVQAARLKLAEAVCEIAGQIIKWQRPPVGGGAVSWLHWLELCDAHNAYLAGKED